MAGLRDPNAVAGLRGPNAVAVTRRAAAVVAAVAALAAACTSTKAPPASGSITVLAAASLTEPFTELGTRFRAAHPGAAVTFSFDASSALAQQVKAGAPADVLATADEATMQPAVTAGLVGAPTVFAHNRLAVLVARGNPKAVLTLADLARPGLIVVLCAPEVPCGRLGAEALERAGVVVRPRSLEPNVKGVVSKVTLFEADAGIVYVTDARAAGPAVTAVEIPSEHNVVTAYPIATVRSAPNAVLADAFVAFVGSGEGRAVLAAAGFQP